MASKYQAYNSFWNSFGWSAYDSLTVPDDVTLPYITYEAPSDHLGANLPVTVLLFDRSNSWTDITNKAEAIVSAITRGGKLIKYDEGAFWIKWASPLSQRMSDDSNDDTIRKIVLNFELEFFD